ACQVACAVAGSQSDPLPVALARPAARAGHSPITARSTGRFDSGPLIVIDHAGVKRTLNARVSPIERTGPAQKSRKSERVSTSTGADPMNSSDAFLLELTAGRSCAGSWPGVPPSF